MNPENLALLDAFNRHFVSLCWVDCELDSKQHTARKPRIFCTSGFLIEYQGEWLWITAGHVLNGIDNELAALDRRIMQSQFVAGWNNDEGTAVQIPLHYEACQRYYVDDENEGADLGIVHIPETVKHALNEAGASPLRNLNYPDHEYDQFLMHGLPKKEQRDSIQESEEGIDCETSIMPVALRVFPLDESVTGGFPQTSRRRFYASVPAEVPLETLDGISGGPIYAIKFRGNSADCYLAAVQNMERQISRTIAACPSALFHEILAKGFAELKARMVK